jgi:exopolysaccharide biosynthesis polyprenyl glycosylphosphotransferase
VNGGSRDVCEFPAWRLTGGRADVKSGRRHGEHSFLAVAEGHNGGSMSTGGREAVGGGIGEAPGVNLGLAESSSSPHELHKVEPRVPTHSRAWRWSGHHAAEAHARRRLLEARAVDASHHARARRARWFRSYQLRLVVVDIVAATIAVGVSFTFRFGTTIDGSSGQYYAGIVSVLPLAWLLLIYINRGYEQRLVGVGAAEFQRIFQAFLHLTALVAFTSFVTKADLARGFVLTALPMALLLDVLGRYGARKWLHRERMQGKSLNSVVVVGDTAAIIDFTSMVRRDQYAGMKVVGACVPGDDVMDPATISGLDGIEVPLLGDVDSVRAAVALSDADTVAVVSSVAVGPEKLRWISWQLEGTATDLVVSPGLTEVAGPRLHVRPVAGLPLLHVEEPEFTGFRRVLKSAFDRCVAGVSILLLSPLFAALALAVRFGSRGPALFRQVRVGRDGTTFTMVKFRSMYTDAEDRLAALADQSDHGDGVLFKMRNDPRVTPVGRFLRKYSLDELPQLFNVLLGSMSLVGPRPPLPREVARYEEHVHRRLLVKPGLTGLWQVSGRSDLSWEESVRLDLRYVENWSLSEDLMILWKTARAVTAGSGAY